MSFLDESARDPLGRLVNYSELPGAQETLIAPWFGVDLSTSDGDRIRQATRYHAKSSRRVVFQADFAREQRDANAELRELARRWSSPGYNRLEELRHGQGC